MVGGDQRDLIYPVNPERRVAVFLYTVEVEFAIARPPSPRNLRVHTVQLWAETDNEAHLFAAHWLDARPGVVMATGTKITEVIL